MCAVSRPTATAACEWQRTRGRATTEDVDLTHTGVTFSSTPPALHHHAWEPGCCGEARVKESRQKMWEMCALAARDEGENAGFSGTQGQPAEFCQEKHGAVFLARAMGVREQEKGWEKGGGALKQRAERKIRGSLGHLREKNINTWDIAKYHTMMMFRDSYMMASPLRSFAADYGWRPYITFVLYG